MTDGFHVVWVLIGCAALPGIASITLASRRARLFLAGLKSSRILPSVGLTATRMFRWLGRFAWS